MPHYWLELEAFIFAFTLKTMEYFWKPHECISVHNILKFIKHMELM